eukprot:TRINITY_DN36010_c0_g1_i1.p1 TRINITY_DN36010_c0_g1~~TRINITY_DN36010_c0_g1_i1.p1  ORF type:complete len:1004 (+),score=468.73 TRINITY_DN36010_c0_g1_i1:53-3013(+)
MAADAADPLADVADVTNSTAFLSLDALLEEGKIDEKRAQNLREQYKILHDRILHIYNNDAYLLKRGRQLKKQLELEKQKVDKCGEVAKEHDAIIQKNKRELAHAETDLAVAQERESMFQVETIELERKKLTLQEEVDTTIAEEENRMKPQMEQLMKAIGVLRDEIEVTSEQFEKHKKHREDAIRKDRQTRKDMDANLQTIHEKRLELMKLDKEPDRARKQADIVAKAYQTAQKENQSLVDKLQGQSVQMHELEEARKQKEDQRYDLAVMLETQRTAIEQRDKLMENIEAHLEAAKQEGAQHHTMQMELDSQLRARQSSLSSLKDTMHRVIKEKERALRECKRIEQAKSELVSERAETRKQKDVLQRECVHIRNTRKRWDAELEELKRDVDILINNYLKEEMTEKQSRLDFDALDKTIKALERDVAGMHNKEYKMNRRITDLGIQRENMSRESSKNQAQVLRARDELKVKEVVIKELQKRNSELKTRLDQLTEMYSVVKRERSNKAAQIQSASQAMSETQEKIKILENELEVLRRESQNKDKELIKVRRELHDEKTNCENLRVESNKKNNEYKQKKKQIQEQCSQITKLNTVINLTEEEMLMLKKKYEEAVENRNFTGIQLIDRNDELCILYEKCNIQESILKKGQVALKQREEEIRAMAIHLADLQREIDIAQKLLPKVRDLEEDLELLRVQTEDERWRAESLERAIVSPKNQARWRKLGAVATGKPHVYVTPAGSSFPPLENSGRTDMPPVTRRNREGRSEGDDKRPTATVKYMSRTGETPEELQAKEQQLEHKLAEANEKLMEKDLILEEVSELSSRLRKQAVSGKDYTLALAKKMNAYQHTIKQKTKRMMATLSELSMVQATSINLEMNVGEAEQKLQAARERAEMGLPPTEGIEEEYERQQYDRRRQQEVVAARRAALEADRSQPPVVTRTTAEQRPNAYIPQGDLLIPKPYGAHPPFRPSTEMGAINRACRKPKQTEIRHD